MTLSDCTHMAAVFADLCGCVYHYILETAFVPECVAVCQLCGIGKDRYRVHPSGCIPYRVYNRLFQKNADHLLCVRYDHSVPSDGICAFCVPVYIAGKGQAKNLILSLSTWIVR